MIAQDALDTEMRTEENKLACDDLTRGIHNSQNSLELVNESVNRILNLIKERTKRNSHYLEFKNDLETLWNMLGIRMTIDSETDHASNKVRQCTLLLTGTAQGESEATKCIIRFAQENEKIKGNY